MSAPSDINRLQTSTRDLDAASCNGVNDHKSVDKVLGSRLGISLGLSKV